MNRIKTKEIIILSDEELDDLYGIPKLNHADRLKFFSLNTSETALLDLFVIV